MKRVAETTEWRVAGPDGTSLLEYTKLVREIITEVEADGGSKWGGGKANCGSNDRAWHRETGSGAVQAVVTSAR